MCSGIVMNICFDLSLIAVALEGVDLELWILLKLNGLDLTMCCQKNSWSILLVISCSAF